MNSDSLNHHYHQNYRKILTTYHGSLGMHFRENHEHPRLPLMWWYGILPLQLDQGVYQPCDGGVRVPPQVHGRPLLFLEDWSRVQYSCVRQYGGQIAPLVLLTCVGWGELQQGGHPLVLLHREGGQVQRHERHMGSSVEILSNRLSVDYILIISLLEIVQNFTKHKLHRLKSTEELAKFGEFLDLGIEKSIQHCNLLILLEHVLHLDTQVLVVQGEGCLHACCAGFNFCIGSSCVLLIFWVPNCIALGIGLFSEKCADHKDYLLSISRNIRGNFYLNFHCSRFCNISVDNFGWW